MSISEDEVNDIIQDAYVLIARLDSVAHIRDGKSYFFQTAKSVFIQKIRRSRIVPIGQLTEIDAASLSDEGPDPERRLSSRQELERVRRLISGLPDRCRTIFEMRRIHGLPQKEIAKRLGVSENVVEMQAVRGLKLILKALETVDRGEGAAKRRKTETRFEVENNG
ncbi:MAG: sigma-70 family RNA polymerase sigma factor [Asticcacaulis sp.]|uniref:RNA polymerase sigma factor n=1 Tax=Asticcacaulis sp. TaxID=1872648 RepID=UPI0039E4CE99